jgi:hypothetical protein
VFLRGTRVTDAGLRALREALPNLIRITAPSHPAPITITPAGSRGRGPGSGRRSAASRTPG